MKIRTIKINRNGRPVVINASDFRYGSDVLWDAEPKGEEKPEATENADVKVIHKGAGRWVVEVNGEPAHDGTLSKDAAKALAAEY